MTTWGCMVYDERRSFTSYLPLDCPDIAPLLKLVREQVWRRGPGQPGIKGYFVAKRVKEPTCAGTGDGRSGLCVDGVRSTGTWSKNGN